MLQVIPSQEKTQSFITQESSSKSKESSKNLEEKIRNCRICLQEMNQENGKFISPCMCRGSIQYAHEECLKKWIDSVAEYHQKREYITKNSCICCDLCRFSIPLQVICTNSWKTCQQFKNQNVIFFAFLIVLLFGTIAIFAYLLNLLLGNAQEDGKIINVSSTILQIIIYGILCLVFFVLICANIFYVITKFLRKQKVEIKLPQTLNREEEPDIGTRINQQISDSSKIVLEKNKNKNKNISPLQISDLIDSNE